VRPHRIAAGRRLRSGGRPSVARSSAVAAALVTTAALTLAGCSGSPAPGARLSVRSAYMPQPVSADLAAGFLTIVNDGSKNAELTSVTTDAAHQVSVHRTVGGRMLEATHLDVPAHGRLVLESGGNHLMFEQLGHRFTQGETVSVRLHFAASAPVTVKMPVKASTYRPETGS
jgi:periplasmic copper chaperone A